MHSQMDVETPMLQGAIPHTVFGCKKPIINTILMMKLTVLLLLVFTFQVSAFTYGQRINLQVKEASLGDILKVVQKQSGYNFLFNNQYLKTAKPVTVDIRDKSIDEALSLIFKDQPYNYRIEGEIITLVPKENVIAAPADAESQQQVVRGRVTDSLGAPLEGVSVFVEGTSRGTATDNKGQYELQAGEGETILFRLVGYTPQGISVGQLRTIDVILQSEASDLEEVVVVGYGTQKKATLTGAVSSVKGSDLVVTKNENVVNMLAGKMAGVRVVQSSGEPGAFASGMQIRGLGTPLYIIDGVPRNNISRLDANEIESISVLKDASAAIYGVRASNGVVLITTKNGSKGKTAFEYSTYYGTQTPINTPKGLDAVQFMELTNENNIMRGSVAPGTLVYSEETIEKYRSGQRTGTDWHRINTNYYAPQYQHNLQVSGGSEAVDYFVNFSYYNQDGIYKNGDINYERYNFRNNLNAKITESLRAELRINATTDTRNRPFEEAFNFWRAAWTYTPITPAYANYDRRYMQNTEQGLNPLAITDADIVGYKRDNQKLFQSTGNLIWDVPWAQGLVAKASYSYDFTFWENKWLQKPYYLYDYDLNNDVYLPKLYGDPAAGANSSINRNTRFGKNSLLQFALNYDNTFGNHGISLLALYEEGVTDMDNFYASGYIPMTSIEELLGATKESLVGGMNGAPYTQGATDGLWQVANKAVVGRANYHYDDRYYAEFSFRYDGSSKFAPSHQWGFFPSVSAAWRISEESFIKNSNSLSFIEMLKLRASYGVTGDDITATFQFVPGYEYPGGNTDWWPIFLGGQPRETINLKATPNLNLTWYESKIYNIGLDADLWKGLFGFELDIFRRDRDGLMATRTGTIPDWIGESFAQENLNSDATEGFDITLRHRNTKLREFSYGISGNLSFTRHKYRFITRVPSDNQYANWRGNTNNRWSDIWWGYESEGQFQNYEDIWSHAKYISTNAGNSELKPGDYKYVDWNEDGVIDDKDVHPIMGGNYGQQSTPKISYGMVLDAQYKGFDFNIVMQGGALGTIMYDWILARPFISDQSGPAYFYDRWHMQDPLADPGDPRTVWIPGELPTTSQGSSAMAFNASASTSSIYRTDYIRCKSVELGYSFSQNTIKWLGIKGVRVFGSAYNLFTITGLKYLDPEHPSSSYGLVYPLIRTINVGANIKI